ncbi:MAG: T9SS type A sorting domain-containing protein [Crocinitomicaceae bacterium]|nr:T9SS type A sorting domain-containing protein [Crocinitomicaceae bacterium]
MSFFLLTVWDDNAGQPGNIFYQDDYFNTQSPEYSGAMNGFRYYTFMANGKVAVPEIFYVGWEQIGSTSLNVGMDHNIANGDKIYRNVSGSWLTSAFSSSLLIRPVFSTSLNYTLSDEIITETSVETVSVKVYPNPVNELLTIEANVSYFSVTLYDVSGRAVMTSINETQLDVSGLNSGIYIADFRDANGVSLYSGKLIKE